MEQLLAYVVPILALATMTVGWLTEAFAPRRGYGLRVDMSVGLLGSGVAAALCYALGSFAAAGFVVTFAIGLVRAAVAIGGQRIFWARAPVSV